MVQVSTGRKRGVGGQRIGMGVVVVDVVKVVKVSTGRKRGVGDHGIEVVVVDKGGKSAGVEGKGQGVFNTNGVVMFGYRIGSSYSWVRVGEVEGGRRVEEEVEIVVRRVVRTVLGFIFWG